MKNGSTTYPTDMSDFPFDMEVLVDYAVRLWKASNSPTPPHWTELLYRDKAWDMQCALQAEAYEHQYKTKYGKDDKKSG